MSLLPNPPDRCDEKYNDRPSLVMDGAASWDVEFTALPKLTGTPNPLKMFVLEAR
jgi:hypothetical protein